MKEPFKFGKCARVLMSTLNQDVTLSQRIYIIHVVVLYYEYRSISRILKTLWIASTEKFMEMSMTIDNVTSVSETNRENVNLVINNIDYPINGMRDIAFIFALLCRHNRELFSRLSQRLTSLEIKTRVMREARRSCMN